MRKGLAVSTLKTYDFAWCTFALFCVSIGVPLKPVLLTSVCAFICYCTDTRHFKPQYTRGLLAGIQFNIRCYDPSFPSLFSTPAVKLILKGINKAHPSSPDHRQPITLGILHKLVGVLRQEVFSAYTDMLLEAVFMVAFYAFLRCGEFTTQSKSFNSSRDITFSDLVFHASHYCLKLKHSKRGGACSIVVARTDSQFCPFKSMISYLSLRPRTDSLAPLFLIPGFFPMHRCWFNQQLNAVLLKAKMSTQHYSGHSFRIGAATTAANQGMSRTSLQQLGRWSSSAYASYIRPDVDNVLENQRSLKP